MLSDEFLDWLGEFLQQLAPRDLPDGFVVCIRHPEQLPAPAAETVAYVLRFPSVVLTEHLKTIGKYINGVRVIVFVNQDIDRFQAIVTGLHELAHLLILGSPKPVSESP